MNINKLAVVYVRVSTQYQVDNYSVQDQRSLASLAARYGFANVNVQEEQGVSAETLTARPIMKKILEDISNGLIGAIIVSSFTRLSRDMDDIDGRIIKKTCRDHDCVIITPEKLYDFSNEADDDLADLQFFFSKIQKRMNLKPMIRGEYTKAKNGGYVGQPLSIGYDHKWQEETTAKGTRYVADLMIKEDEAAVVRYIHEIFPNYLFRQIAVQLNELAGEGKIMYFPIKYPYLRKKYGKSHREWRDSDIRFIINNDLYIGRMQYAVNSRSPYLRGLDPIYTYRADLRILSDEVFEHNQEIAKMRRRIPIQTKATPHLFSGLMRCPQCDGPITGRRLKEKKKGWVKERLGYTCGKYNRSGPRVCPGFWINEREVIHVMIPILKELINRNLRAHIQSGSSDSRLQDDLESEIKAELEKVSQELKNLVEAVKQGALKLDQVKEENAELQEAKQRLERRLHSLKEKKRMDGEVGAVLNAFDQNFDTIISDLMQNRLRFNTMMRLFFSCLVIDTDHPGPGWRKGKKKGELPECNTRILKFAFTPDFEAYVRRNEIELPDGLKSAQHYVENLSESQGSPCM